jgi:hypothetical protein
VVSQISLTQETEEQSLLVKSEKESDEELVVIYETIQEGAKAFLWAEYQICFLFIAGEAPAPKNLDAAPIAKRTSPDQFWDAPKVATLFCNAGGIELGSKVGGRGGGGGERDKKRSAGRLLQWLVSAPSARGAWVIASGPAGS